MALRGTVRRADTAVAVPCQRNVIARAGRRVAAAESCDSGGAPGERRPALAWAAAVRAGARGSPGQERVPVHDRRSTRTPTWRANSILIEQARRFIAAGRELLAGGASTTRGPRSCTCRPGASRSSTTLLHVVPDALERAADRALPAERAVRRLRGGGRLRLDPARLGRVRSRPARRVVALFGALHPAMFSSDWMPYVYVPAYLAFLVVARLGGGRARGGTPGSRRWRAGSSSTGTPASCSSCPLLVARPGRGGRLAPGGGAGSGGGSRPCLRSRRRSLAAGRRDHQRALRAAVILRARAALAGELREVLLLPVRGKSGGHTRPQVTGYVLWFWWPHANALGGRRWSLARRRRCSPGGCPRGPARRFCWALLAFDALSTAAVHPATRRSASTRINEYYIGYFSWSAPVVAAPGHRARRGRADRVGRPDRRPRGGRRRWPPAPAFAVGAR